MAIIRQSSKIKGGQSQLRSHNEATGSLLSRAGDVDGVGLRQVGGDTQAPTTPVLGATAISPSQINLSWTASTDNVGVASYTLQRSGDNVNWVSLYVGLTTTYSDTGLSANSTYFYRVRAADAAGNTSAWAVASATTQALSTTRGFPRTGYYWIGGASLGSFERQYGSQTGLNLIASSDITVINGWQELASFRQSLGETYAHNEQIAAEAKRRSVRDTKIVYYVDSESLLNLNVNSVERAVVNANNWFLYVTGTSGTKTLSYYPPYNEARNFSNFTTPDSSTGLKYPEWLAKYASDYVIKGSYSNLPAPSLDGIFIDNCFVPKVRTQGDWNKDGITDSSAAGAPSITWWRDAIRSMVLRFKTLNPGLKVTGNLSEIVQYGMPAEWQGIFDGGVMEWLIGPPPICPESFLFGNTFGASPSNFVNLTQAAIASVSDERLMMVHCVPRYQFTSGAPRWQYSDPYYFREMRHGLAFCLVCTNSSYAFDGSRAQSATDKFPEFDFNLGQPVAGAAGAKQTAPNQNGIWRRDFENGIAVWCPKTFTGTINLGGTFYVLRGTFTSNVNGTVVANSTVRDSSVVGLQPGQAVTSLNFSNVMAGYTGARDGFILSRTPT